MNKFYVKGIAYTNKGILVFQERNKKKARKKLNKIDKNSMKLYQKTIRKGKVDYWYKMSITALDDFVLESQVIKAGELYDQNKN